jgi:hypothetical protein
MKVITVRIKIKTEVTEIFRFHLHFFSVSLTSGSINIAVRSAKMRGIETGIIKMKIKIVMIKLAIMIKFRFVSHFVKGYSPRVCTTEVEQIKNIYKLIKGAFQQKAEANSTYIVLGYPKCRGFISRGNEIWYGMLNIKNRRT